jgi:hypothetical protein
LEYPALSISGTAIRATVAAVAMEEPDTVAKAAQAATAAMPSPPGM